MTPDRVASSAEIRQMSDPPVRRAVIAIDRAQSEPPISFLLFWRFGG
jgi:hypothetical protein